MKTHTASLELMLVEACWNRGENRPSPPRSPSLWRYAPQCCRYAAYDQRKTTSSQYEQRGCISSVPSPVEWCEPAGQWLQRRFLWPQLLRTSAMTPFHTLASKAVGLASSLENSSSMSKNLRRLMLASGTKPARSGISSRICRTMCATSHSLQL